MPSVTIRKEPVEGVTVLTDQGDDLLLYVKYKPDHRQEAADFADLLHRQLIDMLVVPRYSTIEDGKKAKYYCIEIKWPEREERLVELKKNIETAYGRALGHFDQQKAAHSTLMDNKLKTVLIDAKVPPSIIGEVARALADNFDLTPKTPLRRKP